MTDPDRREEDALEDDSQPFISHLLELRDRLLRMILSVVIVFLSIAYWSNPLYHWLSKPLLRMLPAGSKMIATEVASPFITPFKFTFMVAIFICIPYIIYQVWRFVAPGLYAHERRMILPIVASSVVLFYIGMAFAYYAVFPVMFKFFSATTPSGVAFSPDISKYLSFVLTIFFAFGVAFEVPIATIVLVWLGVTTPEKLRKMRPYVIVGVFAVAAVLTPPDIFSQSLLAFPMWALFEVGLLFSRFYVRNEEDEEEIGADMSGTATAAAGPANSADTAASDYTPMSDEEMDAELDRMDRELDDLSGEHPEGDGDDGRDTPDEDDKKD